MDESGKMVEKTTDKCIVIPFTDERDMLMKYLELYEYINPSIVTVGISITLIHRCYITESKDY